MTSMDGPLAMTVPANATQLDLLIAGSQTPDIALLPEYIKMAKELGPLLETHIQEERIELDEIRSLTQARGTIEEILVKLNLDLQNLRLPSWDEFLSNLTSCDSLALSQRLWPLEYQITFVKDSKDRLEVKIRSARLGAREKTLHRRKTEALESQLLCAISILETETAMATIREREGGAVVFGKRTEKLREAAREAMRQLGIAEDALREERNTQLIAEQRRMATGMVTRAEIASAVPTL